MTTATDPRKRSDVYAIIQKFQSGEMDRETFISTLANYQYATPEYRLNMPDNPFEREQHIDAAGYTPGTFMDVKLAYAAGEIPRDVFYELLRRMQAIHPAGQKPILTKDTPVTS